MPATMKRILFFITSIMTAAVTTATAADKVYQEDEVIAISGDVTYLDVIRFENREISKDASTVTLSMDIVLDYAYIRNHHTVSLTPVIVSKDGKTEWEMETIIVDGRQRNKVYLSRKALGHTDAEREAAQAIIRRKNGKDQEYAYMSSLPYEKEMLDGSVKIYESVSGCASCAKGESEMYIGKMMTTFVPQWKTDTVALAPEPAKVREESRSAIIKFNVNKADIVPSLGRNGEELENVKKSISLVQERPYLTITKIHVTGYSSPEGTYEYNLKLSSERAKAYADYISRENRISQRLFIVDEGGENWEGLKRALGNSSFYARNIVTDIIDKYKYDRDECEKVMRKTISKEDYKWMLEEIYPMLRECVYRIEYDVRDFTIEEAQKFIYDNPKDLNLTEMLQVAWLYDKNTDEYEYAMSTAGRFYPDDPAYISQRAQDLMEDEDYKGVIRYLERKAGDNPTLINTYGVACALTEDYDAAKEAFQKAAYGGCGIAKDNLLELENLLSQQ